ncbi:hypothetical protein EJ02DRAFT_469208 [Clathrospora elynae]|uniref:Uncharacterized protein n=1 Tax=Clathrospora elynae TaxID=706981 RepID=A0A6A5SHV7_9PLEO|nr:hypothetical protein EJ02DRAFT_469208 [Clathrospora elynae]
MAFWVLCPSPFQTTSCLNAPSGPPYDELMMVMQDVDAETAAADEQSDDDKVILMKRYKQYVERCLKHTKIQEHALDISVELPAKLGGRTPDDHVEVFHISAADYISWTNTLKMMFKGQPALRPMDTGIPRIRQFLFNTPAQQNLLDSASHIGASVSAFVEKRIAMPGFARSLMSLISFVELLPFGKVLRSRGTLRAAASQAKPLKPSCNRNKELATVLAPGFRNWCLTSTKFVRQLRRALRNTINLIYQKAMNEVDESAANILIIEKAKTKLQKMRPRLQLKIQGVINEIDKTAKSSLYWATMEDERDSSIISFITESILDQFFTTLPPLYQPKRASTTSKKFAITKAPIDYLMTPVGEAIRTDLKDLLPTLEEKAVQLRNLLPGTFKLEDETVLAAFEKHSDVKDKEVDLMALYTKAVNLEAMIKTLQRL